MLLALFCVLLLGNHVQAIVNKGQVVLIQEKKKLTKVKVDDRISNSFDSPSDDYGPPLGSGFKGPAPVYGPPELVGNLGPTPVYPPPPPELPPPVFGPPAVSYGPPRSIKPQYGPPKQSFGLAASSLLLKPTHGPPKFHYGPPKQHFTPPSASLPLFISPKPQYGPPLKLVGTSSQQYIPPPAASQHGPPKPGHGPPIPISLETYGPPPPKLAIQFNPLPNDEYGPPPLPVAAPQPQYGVPAAGDLYGPPPPAPPPGVPAPPTPPDIKYDGWQPIAGLATSPNQSGPPADTYGLPDAKHNYIEGTASAGLSHAALSISTNSNVPSDSYGVPIHNPEAQDLKTSVHDASASSESNGLPPPPLPQHEPLHNNQGPGVVGAAGQSDHQFGRQQLNLQYGTPNIEPLSITKTVGFQLLPASGALNTDLSGLSLSGGTSDVSSFNHISNSVNANSASLHTGLELSSDDGAAHNAVLNSGGDSHGFQNAGNDLSLLQSPQQTPSADYGPPLTTFGKSAGTLSGASLLSPPPLDSYGAPPLSSYSPNGPYSAVQGGRSPFFSSFGLFHKQNLHPQRIHGPPFRLPPVPLDSLMPPRTREPIKFREPIPTGLLSNINRYLPPPAKLQLPNFHAPVSFHTSGSGNLFSGSFASAGSFNGNKFLNSPIAAPHAQYGTPLSFTDFNAATPHLTYGAPNFGPPTSFVSTSSGFGSNLYSGVSDALTTTYGTPINSLPIGGGGHDCNTLQPLLPVNGAAALHPSSGLSASGELPLSGSLPSSGESHSSGELHSSGGLSSGFGEVPSSNELSGGGLSARGGAHSSGKLQLDFGNTGAHAGSVKNPELDFTNSPSAGFPSTGAGDFTNGNNQNSIYAHDSLPFAKPLDNFLGGPPVNTLDLQHNEQQKINLKDSYGNPIGLTYDSSNEASGPKAVHAPTADVSNELSVHSSSQSQNIYPAAASFEHGSGISAEALTASLTLQGLGQEKSFASNEIDANQFLKSSEGSEALSLAQKLTADNANDFEIQGSKGIYRLQIQPADGGLGTENSDGSIRHDQVVSNGLLQSIIAAIEEPENAAVQLQDGSQIRQLEKVYGSDLLQGTGVPNGHFITVDGQKFSNGIEKRSEQVSDKSEDKKHSKNHSSVALFFDTKYGEAIKESRSVSKSEAQAAQKEQNNGKSS